ncbi:TonB-dependent receptor [Dechloromonas sp. XY25]|uniref:TonB-dependent receptor n=1 Tax=Dechloromonas hankyongensis TaxID=2908002 RepID=A0ABS9JYG2_9RHOO|nr:TonB-dependent receptor [Dechloromonas hankyongensis]MCG2575954.1 TonB-dependent receptor [Dechloromonas hankyongensis]
MSEVQQLSPTWWAAATLAVMSAQSWSADEGAYFSDLPVVASVSRLPQRLADAPTAVTVIDRDMIKASGARELSDVFRLVPGFQTYPHSTEPARVSYHGLNDEDYSPRVQVLIDGRSMYSPLFGNGVNWATLPVALEDIERIEVVRGSNSVSYGSNAFLGVINIITIDPSLTRGVSVSTNYGSQNVRDYGLRVGGRVGEIGDFRFTYRQQNDDALANRYDWIDDFRSRLFDLRFDATLDERNTLQVNAGRSEGISGVGRLSSSSFFGQSTNPIRSMRQTDTYAQLTWRHVVSATNDFQIRYAYVADRSDDAFNIVVPLVPVQTFHINQSGDEGTRHEFEFLHNLHLASAGRLAWGASWREDAMRSAWVLPGQGTVHRDTGRIFGNWEAKPTSWLTTNLGLAGENDSLAGFHWSPRASTNFHLSPENTVRVGYSRAYRSGSTYDYRADYRLRVQSGAIVLYDRYLFAADRDLKPEQLDTWELGYLGDWRAWRASLDVRLYDETIKDRLYTIDRNVNSDTVPSLTTPIQDVHIHGLEYQLKWQPFEPTRLVLTQSFPRISSDYLPSALSYPRGTLSQATANRNVDELTERSAPRRSTSLLWMQGLPYGLQFSLAGYWQDKMKWTSNSWSAKYRRFDARLAYPFRVGAIGGEVAYVVQSLNGAHGEYKTYDGSGTDPDGSGRIVDRRQWVALRLDF